MRTILLAVLFPSAAFAQVIPFDDLDLAGTGLAAVDDVTGDSYYYSSAGFEFAETTGPHGFWRYAQGHPNYPGSTHMFNNTVNGVTELTAPSPFAISQIDIAELGLSPTPVTVNFTGTQVGGTTVTASFTTDGVTPMTQTFTFPPNFTNLELLSWVQESPFHKFDNLVMGGGGGGFQAFVTTSCPNGGPGAIAWAGGTPNGQVAILGAASGGATAVPGGPCAGTITQLGPMGLVGILGSDVNGTGALGGTHTQQDCGTNIQLLDIATCTLSNVAIAQ